MSTFSSPYRRAPGLLLVVIVHLGLLQVLLQSRRQIATDDAPRGPAIQWLRQTAQAQALASTQASAAAPTRPSSPPAPKALPAPKRATRPIAVRQEAAAFQPQATPAEPAEPATAPATVPATMIGVETPAPPAPSAADIVAQAKRNVGKIDRELRQQFPQRGIQKKEDTAFQRMQQGFADAYAAVPPKWYESSRIEEIGADAKNGIRVYKISSALGSICVSTIPGRGGETTLSLCP